MAEITKSDIDRIYEKLDEVKDGQTTLAVSVAEIKTKMEMMPQFPKRPCQYFDALKIIVDAHLLAASQNARDWKEMLVGLVGEVLKYGVIALIAFLIGSKVM
jgi:hypothetical protein